MHTHFTELVTNFCLSFSFFAGTDNYHASQGNVAGGYANTVTGHQQIVRGTIPQTQQPSVDGSQKNPQQQGYQQQQQQQRQNQQQQPQYQRAPTKNLNTVGMRPPSQPTLNNQLIGTQGGTPMFIPQGYAYTPQNAPYPLTMQSYPIQYGTAMAAYNRPYNSCNTVFYGIPSNMAYGANPRGTTPQMAAAAPVQSMPPGNAVPQQTLMTNQMVAPPVTPQQTTTPVQPKRPSRAVPIINPVTKDLVIVNNSSVDVSETVSNAQKTFLSKESLILKPKKIF